MSAQLSDLLQHVLQGEPELGDEVDAVFRRADRLRRLRTRALLGAGAAAVAVIAAAGFLLAVTLLPASTPSVVAIAPPVATPSAALMPSSSADPVLAVIAPLIDEKDMQIFPRARERGDGWRQYSVLDSDGRARGTVDVAIYHVAQDMCFPVRDAPDSCARTQWAPRGVEFVRYDDEKDADWQVHQTIARRISDGRTLAVMATGERDAGASRGKPALSGAQIEKVATGQEMFDAFGADEHCTGPSDADCPVFKVPVPTDKPMTTAEPED
jgi:hypothetical protein